MDEDRKGRVLVADDEPSVLGIFQLVLERAGYAVDTASSGEEAVALFREGGAEGGYDVVLTDLMMPGMSGIEVLSAIRGYDLDVPVVLITAAPTMDSAIRAVEHGALRYLMKPVRHSDLVEVVERAVRLRKMAALKRQALALMGGDGSKQVGDTAGLEVTFERALQQLRMVYQPIVRWSEKRVYAYEALVRSGEERLPHPGALFDAAERLGRTDDLGRAIRRLAPLPFVEVPEGTRLFINLHTSDLNDETLFDRHSPLARISNRVVLEITERASLEGVGGVQRKIAALRRIGYQIAVDDLGAGYAGLSAFSLLEPDVCKLDMTLVRDVDARPTQQKLVGAMGELCRDLGIGLVAEGVETAAERDTLVGLGCDLLQGFLFAKPGSPFPAVAF